MWGDVMRTFRLSLVGMVILTLLGGLADGVVAQSDEETGPVTPVPSPAPVASTAPTATPTPTLRTAYDLPSFAELVKLFDYDTTEPLGYTVTYEEQQDGVTVRDITYPSGGYDVFGKLVDPRR